MSAEGSLLQGLNFEAALWAARMGHACLGGGLFIAGVWAACRLAPRLPAALRAWLWWVACLKLVLDLAGIAPLAVPLLPAAPALRVMQASQTPAAPAMAPNPILAGQTAGAAALPAANDSRLHSALLPHAAHVSWPLFLQLLWLAGVLFHLGRSIRQGLQVRRWRTAAAPWAMPPALLAGLAADLGLRRVPPLLESAAVSAPCVTGGFQPTILLPLHFSQRLSLEEVRLALAHEMAHVRRGDLRLACLPALVQAVFFFHPLAWLSVREWAAAREEACDALALAATGAAPAQFGHLLLKMAGRGAHAPALGLSPGYHTLRRRLAGLTSRPSQSRQARWLLAAALLGLFPWRLTAAVRSHPPGTGSEDRPAVRYAISDLGDVTEAAGLNVAGQAALTWRDGQESQGLTGRPDALTLVGSLPKHHFSIAYGINSYGQVAAASYNIPGHGRAFLWNGSPRRLGSLPGYPYSEARAVNDAGQVAGYAETGGHDRWKALVARAFVWQSGEMTDLGTLGGPHSYAFGLNNQGQVVGKADTETFGETHAFVWQNGQMQDLGTLGGANSVACRVNEAGIVVGSAETGDGETRHAFIWQSGTMRDLGTLPGLPGSVACGINAPGQIVGYAEAQSGSQNKRAVLWHQGRALDLNIWLPPHSGWILSEARAINDRGQIAGNGIFKGQPRAFLLTPR